MPLPHSSQGTYSAALSRSAENPSSPYAAGARHLLRKLRRRRLRVVHLRANAISYQRSTTQRPSAVFFDLKKCRLATLPFNCHICAHTSLSQHCYKTTYLARTNFRWSSKARWSMKRWRQWWHWIGASSFVPTFSRDPSPDLDRPWSRCELMDLCQTPLCARSLSEPHEAPQRASRHCATAQMQRRFRVPRAHRASGAIFMSSPIAVRSHTRT